MARRRIEVQPISSLEDALGYKFKNQNLLRQALTHPTAVTERHPDAFKHDLTVLAFIGDAVLKYSAARYLFLNGQMDLTANRAQMHEGVQNIISNRVLGEIGEEKLHLEQYLIRGNSIQNVNMNVYADCVEAILGAIALDCEVGGQEIIFRVIEKICFDRIEHLLKSTTDMPIVRLCSRFGKNVIDWPRNEIILAAPKHRSTVMRQQRNWCSLLCRFFLWIFAIFGFFGLCMIFIFIAIQEVSLNGKPTRRWYEL